MKINNQNSCVFVLFAVLYFPFVYFGQLSMSASFVRGTDMSSGIVNYIGALYNIIALIYLLSKNSIVRSKHTQGLTRALLVWMLLVFLNSIVNAPNVGRIFKDFNYGTMWVTHLLLYYSLARKKDINKKTVIQVFTLLIILSVIMTFRMFKAMMIDLGALHALGFNAVYFVICLFPWFFLIEKRWLKMFIFFIAIIAVLFSQKRTAIVALILQLSICIISYLKTHKGLFTKIVMTIGLVIGLFGVFNYVNDSFLEGGITARFEKTENDEMGSRPMIWAVLLAKYDNSNLLDQLFGHGCESFLLDGGLQLTAHNDYFETLYDYGLISLIVLLVIIFYLMKFSRRIYIQDYQLGTAYLMSLIGFLPLTMTSHLLFIHPCQIVFITAMWGFSLSSIDMVNYQTKNMSNENS